MKRPLAGLVVVYACGIWFGSQVAWRQSLLCALVLALLGAFLLLSRTRLSHMTLLALVLAGGMLACRHALAPAAPDSIGRLLGLRDQNAVVRGAIISDPGYRADQKTEGGLSPGERHNFRLQVTALMQTGSWQSAEGVLWMSVDEKRGQEPLRYGDVIECSMLLRVPAPARNPGEFDWRGWLARQGIAFTGTIRPADSCVLLARDRGNPVIALSLRLREKLERALRLGLEDDPQTAGVLAGMVLGERSEIPADTSQEFQSTGVFHVFSINGLHVGLVAAIVVLLLRAARFPRRWRGLVVIPLLVIYVFATGGHPGEVRALVMVSVWLIGWMLVRPTDSLNNLAAAALIILVAAPGQLFDSGFILSFTVVTAIVVLTPCLEEKLVPLVAHDPFLPRQSMSHWHEGMEMGMVWGVRLFSCSVAAWVGLVPLLAADFHLFTPIGILANLLVIPLLSIVIALGLTAVLAYGAWPWLTLTLNNAALVPLNMLLRCVGWLARIPYGHWFVQAPPGWAIAGYYGIGLLLLNRRMTWPRRRLIAVIAATAVGATALAMAWPGDAVDVTVLDLDDGMSVFLNAHGAHGGWLIDGGGQWGGQRVVLPFLRAQGVNSLGALLLTRGDEAHAAGLTVVAREIPAARAVESGVPSRSKFYSQWLEALRDERTVTHTVRAGDEMMVGNRLRVRVLNPPRDETADRSDDNSLVLLLEYGPTRLLLMSDAGATVEDRLLGSGENLRAGTIIKGRPGKESSCTGRFLDAVRPETVVQVVNVRPSDRYLQPDLVERLQQRGITLYRTDESGAVILRITPQGCTVRPWLP
jgi:competence protein ComEC